MTEQTLHEELITKLAEQEQRMQWVELTLEQLWVATAPDKPMPEKTLTTEQLEHLAGFEKLRLPRDYRPESASKLDEPTQ